MFCDEAPYVCVDADRSKGDCTRRGLQRIEHSNAVVTRRAVILLAFVFAVAACAGCTWTSSKGNIAPIATEDGLLQLWTWGGLWSGAVARAKDVANKTATATDQAVQDAGSAAQRLQNSPQAQDVAHAAQKASGDVAQWGVSAAHQTEQAAGYVGRSAGSVTDLMIKNLRDQFIDNTYDVQPCCLVAMEIALAISAGVAVPGVLLAYVGFTEEGVAAESIASVWQSALGDVGKGSSFAWLQSLGARGLVATSAWKASGVAAAGSFAFCEVVDPFLPNCSSKR